MTDTDLRKIELWCYDADAFLSQYLDADLAAMSHESIVKSSGKKRALFMIADDLAEGISDLPDEDRIQAQKMLKEKHGFGYEHFQQRKLRVIESILENGRISSMSQYEKAMDFSSDTTNDQDTVMNLAKIIAAYEEKLIKKKARK